jgi:hypothetical protein
MLHRIRTSDVVIKHGELTIYSELRAIQKLGYLLRGCQLGPLKNKKINITTEFQNLVNANSLTCLDIYVTLVITRY